MREMREKIRDEPNVIAPPGEVTRPVTLLPESESLHLLARVTEGDVAATGKMDLSRERNEDTNP